MADNNDLHDVVTFLAETLPFSALSDDGRLAVARHLSVDYVPRHQQQPLDLQRMLYIIRTGAFELRTDSNELIDRLGEHDLFGINTLMTGNPNRLRVYPIEDALVFKLAESEFMSLCEAYEPMRQFFRQVSSQRDRLGKLKASQQSPNRVEQQLTQRVGDFASGQPISCPPDHSIQQAARVMREQRVSSLLLLDGDRLAGIVTDRDLRNRVVAEGLDVGQPVRTIATETPVTIEADALLFDAQRIMSQQQIHHLPVVKAGRVSGMITATDLVRAQQVSPLYLINDILRQSDLATLAELRHRVPVLIHNWVQAEVSPYEMGRVLAAIGDAFVQQCLTLAQREMGEAPMPFAWLAFGSQARMDQTFASDQDNGLILAREPNAAEQAYFQSLGDWVCQALDQCGYVLCPGDIMASNPKWRRTADGWLRYFWHWLDEPTPEALLNGSIFLDLRVIDGPAELLAPVQQYLQKAAPKAALFLAMMTQTAVRSGPPIGFFRQFVVKSSGEHEDELDLKHRGVALINDLARIYALAAGSLAVNSLERLQAAARAGTLSEESMHSLQEAWSLIAQLRIEEQSKAMRDGRAPTSFLDPDQLSSLTRAHLKDAFSTIKKAQQSALHTFAKGQHG
ncbi:MAG: DUF294 nucleotidyltransferase-like domain-containing protein [Saccharospirillum sp.]